MIRTARERDAEALTRIYNQAMRPGSYATIAVEPESAQERLAWLRCLRHPFGAWVYEVEPGVIGAWCALVPFAVRPAYPGIAEVSVYVEESLRGRQGATLGGALLIHLIDVARKRSLRSLVSIVFEKNATSVSGCLLAGFRPMGVLREAASVAGELENVLWTQKDLAARDTSIVREILERLAALPQESQANPEERKT